ncbi:hypothetical protein AGMMS49992_29850 [Clostridia bacterium]|nr:hypothetical protein AGMMS49992_29850 [Clostridia bacterium]
MSEWIKCSDRLPQYDEPVLMHVTHNDQQDICFGCLKRGRARWGDIWEITSFKCRRHNLVVDRLEDVSHWQPLPQPPKEDKQDA